MRQFLAFTRKEVLGLSRTGKLFLCFLLFTLFGIMSPALAKLTPWLMEQFATTLADSGIVVIETKVDALASWQQFYKNVSMIVILFSVLFAGILTTEYQRGTLVNIVTKGLARWKIILSKWFVVAFLWTILYWWMFVITYGYNEYFWGNASVTTPLFAGSLIYLFGLFIVSVGLFFSTILSTSTAVIAASAVVIAGLYIVSIVPTLTAYLPTYLLSAQAILTGAIEVADYTQAIVVTSSASFVLVALSLLIFNKKAL